MPDLTDNHEYKLPQRGEEDWDVPLNENIERFDTGIEIRDEETNRGDYEPKAGAKFLATDSGVMYVGTGSRWQYVMGTGNTPVVDYLDVEFDGTSRSNALRLWWNDGGGSTKVAGHDYSASSHTWRFTVSGDHTTDGVDYLSMRKDVGFGLGVFAPQAALDVKGRNNWDLENTAGDLRVGTSDHRLKAGVATGGAGAGIARIRSQGGQNRLILGGGTNDVLDVGTDGATVQGDLDVEGNKNFVHAVDTDDGEREVVYTASEAGTPHTEVSGVAELSDGRAEVDLPEHFAWVTAPDEPVVVQITPYGGTAGTKVVERSTDRIVVEDLDGEGDYDIAYTVKGTREGQATKEVVRERSPAVDADEAGPTPADD
jgi:hypothetical protein